MDRRWNKNRLFTGDGTLLTNAFWILQSFVFLVRCLFCRCEVAYYFLLIFRGLCWAEHLMQVDYVSVSKYVRVFSESFLLPRAHLYPFHSFISFHFISHSLNRVKYTSKSWFLNCLVNINNCVFIIYVQAK